MKKQQLAPWVLIASVSLAVAFPASAVAETPEAPEPPQPPRSVWWEHLDFPADMAVTREDIERARQMRLEERFEEMDLNNDGYISEEEFVEAMKKRAEEQARRTFTRMDEDETGQLTKEQFTTFGPGAMARNLVRDGARTRVMMHRDGDGEIIIRRQGGSNGEEREVIIERREIRRGERDERSEKRKHKENSGN